MGSGRDYLNLHNGNHILEFTDFVLPFYNSPLMLKRYYNNRCDVTGMFGEGWHCNWEMGIQESGDDRKFIDETGAEWLFAESGGSYTRPAGLFANLVKEGDDTYTLTYLRNKTEVRFDTSGKFVSVENKVGVKHEVTRSNGKITKVETKHTDETGTPVRRTLEFTYNEDDLVSSVKETAENREISFEYDGNDRLLKVTLPNEDYCEFGYADTYKLDKFIDYNTNVTFYEYDGSNRLDKRIGACGDEHGITYNANQTVVNDPRSKNWTHNFDGTGRRTSLVTPRSKTYSWTYNSDNLILTYVVPGPITFVTNTYDSDGFIQTTTDALNKHYSFTWDGNDLLETITDPDSNDIDLEYNADRLVTSVTNQESETTEYAYSSLGALEKITDPKDFVTEFENDIYGMPTKITDPIGNITEIAYDDGNIKPVSIIGKDGNTTTYSYDKLKRLLYKQFSNGDRLESTYSGFQLEKLEKWTYDNGVKNEIIDYVRYAFNGRNKIISLDTGPGGTTRYTFNKNGQVLTVHAKDCQLREYSYDDDGNLTKVQVDEDSNKDYDFEVDDRGWRTKITYPNSWYVEIARNDRGQISTITLKDDQDTQKHRISYAYNNLALISDRDEIYSDNNANIEVDFTRDDVGRVTREHRTITQGAWGTDYDLNLTYDDNGNITRIQDQEQGGKDYKMSFDALNRLIKYYEDTGSEKGIFSYNCLGLLKGKEVDGNITKFEYDDYNVLNEIITSAGASLDFNFDLLGKLRQYDTSTRESTFDYEGSKRLGDYDDYAQEWKRYHWCKTQLLGYEDDTNTYYIVPDVTGSTKIIIDSNSVVNRLDYDHLGYLRNKITDPQVELLWKALNDDTVADGYIDWLRIYIPEFGYVKIINKNLFYSYINESQFPIFPGKDKIYIENRYFPWQSILYIG
ncbi:RHS repeat protein [bacterium]|nr:RHS repeat protein [bacterium]